MKMAEENRIKLNNMAKYLCLHLSLIMVIALLAIPSDCSHHEYDDHHPKTSRAALFAFGDSLFDPGNNNYLNTTTDFQANFPPYGESFFKYPTGRFCDGRVIPDFIAEYANLPLIPPYLQTGYDHHFTHGVNFASGGAGALAETFAGLVIDLKMQLRNFKVTEKRLRLKLGKRGAKQLVSNSVYLFCIGNNDYLSALSANSATLLYAPEDYIAMVVGNITAVFEEIYKKGGRKFGVMNLGPLGCLPGLRASNLAAGGNGECAEPVTDIAKLHNVVLFQKLEQLQKQLKGFKYSYFDFFNFAAEIFADPSKYGFKEVKSACCGSGPFRGDFSCGGRRRKIKEFELCSNPQDHLFFDSNHPSEVANKLLAEVMWAGPPDITGPYNLKSLFELGY